MSVKTKLLEAVGDIDIKDIGEEALVEILVNKIAALEKEVKRMLLESQHNILQEEFRRLRRDPLYGAEGSYFFLGRGKNRFHVQVRGQMIDLIEREKKIDFRLQMISPQQFEITE